MPPSQPHINDLVPHPSPLSEVRAEIKQEDEGSSLSALPSQYTIPRPLNIQLCPNGCHPKVNILGEIAHYSRGDISDLRFPFRRNVSGYDTFPPLDACKVVILNGGQWLDNELSRPYLRTEWQPCWVVSFAFHCICRVEDRLMVIGRLPLTRRAQRGSLDCMSRAIRIGIS